jgi:hypothetical protein
MPPFNPNGESGAAQALDQFPVQIGLGAHLLSAVHMPQRLSDM